MVTKIKGIFKGFKYISQIFVVKEKEMEIGLPTDVKHVAHIGWDGQSSSRSGSAPSWMNEFRAAPDFSATSLGSIGEPRDSYSTALSTWSSQDFDQSIGHRPTSDMFHDFPPIDSPNGSKHNRKKTKPSSSPKSISSSRSSRASKSKAAAHAGTNPMAKLQF